MTEFSEAWLVELVRATLVVSLAVVVAALILHSTRAKPATRVVTWILTLIPCWLMVSVAVQIPWFEPITDSEITSMVQWNRLESPVVPSSLPAFAIESKPHHNSPIAHYSPLAHIALGLLLVWISGIVFLIIKYARSYARFRTILSGIVNQQRDQPMSDRWFNEFEDFKSELTIRPEAKLRISENLGPILCRFQHQYYVIVPEAFWESRPAEQRRAILLHELCHVKRADVWLTFLARLLILPQWFNPIAWHALRQLGESIEMACDDEVLQHEESGRFEYAKSLVSLVEFKQNNVSFTLSAGGPPVRKRIQRIINPEGIEMKFARMLTIGSLVLISSLGLIRPELVAQNPRPDGKSGLESGRAYVASLATEPVTHPVEQAAEKLVTRTYYVGDIVLPQIKDPKLRLQGVLGFTIRAFEPVKQFIVENVSTDHTWFPEGLGTLEGNPPDLSLIITQTRAAHEEINALIEQLRDLNAVTVELDSFVALLPKDHNLFSGEAIQSGKTVANALAQNILAAKKKKLIKCFEVPATQLYSGQGVVYKNLDGEIWSVNGVTADVLSLDQKNIQISLSALVDAPGAPRQRIQQQPASPSPSRQDLGHGQGQGRNPAVKGRHSETIKTPPATDSFLNPLMPSMLGTVTIEDNSFVAVEITSLLKESEQDQRAIWILHGKLNDKRKQVIRSN